MAAEFENNDRMTVDDDSAFEVSAITIEAWVRPDAFASAALSNPMNNPRAAVFDHDGAYSIFIDDAGQVFCNGVNVQVPAGGQLAIGQWSHVACTIENGGDKVVYVDGAEVGRGTANIDIADGSGSEIGGDAQYAIDDSHFIGAIDNLLIWTVARSRAQLCQTAGLDCP